MTNVIPFRAGIYTRILAKMTTEYSYEYAMPPVYDQGQYGFCVSNATAALCQFFHFKRTGETVPISRRAIQSQGKHSYSPLDITDDGMQVSDGLNIPELYGSVTEAEWPYLPDAQPIDVVLAPVPATLWNRTFLFQRFASVPYTVSAMRMALLKHGPLSIANTWCSEWNNPGADGKLDPKPVTQEGGHNVLLVGFTDEFSNLDGTKGAFRLRNSWGTSWGDKGHGWMPYSAYMTAAWPDEIHTIQA